MATFLPPPGTSDIFPEEIQKWCFVEDTAKRIFSLYGFGELRTPVFEYTELFQRGLGNETEVVKKEMYTFEDRGGRSLTLRPEGTAGVMRAFMGTDVMNGNEKRIFYIGPMFRGERPAAGRRRQFHQVGVENAGRVAPALDAENIAMLMHYLNELGITGSKLLLNTRGAMSDREPAEAALRDYFSERISSMCDDCANRLDRNVWRILDCKCDTCQEAVESAPDAVSLFSDETKDYFAKVKSTLDDLGVPYEVDSRLVRGLDYYVHTVFEVVHDSLGAQNAIAGGGRYEVFLPNGKKPVVGVGFAAGVERLLMTREALGITDVADAAVKPVYLVALGEEARDFNMVLADRLRRVGVSVISEVENKSMKAQMRTANRLDVQYVVICGESELEKGVVVCKSMDSGTQSEFSPEELLNFLTGKKSTTG